MPKIMTRTTLMAASIAIERGEADAVVVEPDWILRAFCGFDGAGRDYDDTTCNVLVKDDELATLIISKIPGWKRVSDHSGLPCLLTNADSVKSMDILRANFPPVFPF